MTNDSLPREKYFYLFADQILTKGFTRTMIADTSRKALHFIDNTYYEALLLCRQHTIGEITEMLETEKDIELFCTFIFELIGKKLGIFVDDISLFPQVEMRWDHPSVITNSIIDIRDKEHDWEKIFTQLDELGCEYVEIRSYREQTIKEIEDILKASSLRRLKKVFIVTRYSEQHAVRDLSSLYPKYTFLALTIYGTPHKLIAGLRHSVKMGVKFFEQTIHSAQCCGNISLQGFQVPQMKAITENILFNGCLNRKISIDENGFIKNCPSSTVSYGHIDNDRLQSVIKKEAFTFLWGINKDQIKECSDCEYRSICTDCRVFVKNEQDIYSKPSKCKYDPYSGKWES